MDKLLEHVCRDVEVGDDAVLQRALSHDGAGGAADHFFGFGAYGNNFMRDGANIHSNNGGLADDDALPLDEDECIGGAQIYSDILRKQLKNSFQS